MDQYKSMVEQQLDRYAISAICVNWQQALYGNTSHTRGFLSGFRWQFRADSPVYAEITFLIELAWGLRDES